MFLSGIQKHYGNRYQESDIKKFWENFDYTSANSGARRPQTSRKKLVYQHIRSNQLLTEFQMDLVFTTKNITKQKFKTQGHLLAIDINSRALFEVPFKSKRQMSVTFTILYKKIKKLQGPEFLHDVNRQCYFYSDLDFSIYHNSANLNKSFQDLEKRDKLKFLPLTKTNPYLLDRVSRTLHEYMGYEFQKQKLTIKTYNELLTKAVAFYNKRPHSSLGNRSPDFIIKNGHTISNIPVNFNYEQNKAALLRKKKTISSIVGLLSPVRIHKIRSRKNVNQWEKRYASSFYSDEIVYVSSYKVPTLSSDPIKLILMRRNGERYIDKYDKKSLYSLGDIKILTGNSFKLIINSVSRMVDTNMIKVKIKGIKNNFFLTKDQILKSLVGDQKIMLSLKNM